MSDKKSIETMIQQINKDYLFTDDDGTELRIHANPNLNGYELWLYRVNGGGVVVMFTQYQQITARYALLILKMLYHDILERQSLGHYQVSKRTKKEPSAIIVGS